MTSKNQAEKTFAIKKACVYNKAGEQRRANGMRYRTQGKSPLETRVDYVEGNLDKAINSFRESNVRLDARLDETIRDFRESNARLDARLDETIRGFRESINETRRDFKDAV